MQQLATARRLAIQMLESVGLDEPARRAKASGWLPWTPLVPADKFFVCCLQAIEHLQRYLPDQAIGDYVEFGVSRGTSLACVHRALNRKGLSHVRLFGFDSFEGLPPEAANEGWKPGAFKSTLPATRRYLTAAGVDWNRVALVRGWFNDTLNPETRARLNLHRVSLIMVDCDTHSSSRDALWFSRSLIQDRAIVFLDDWETHENAGQQRAFQQFLTEFPEFSAESLPTYAPLARTFLVTRR